MEHGELKKSPAIDEVIKVSYKMFLFTVLCLTMISPITTDIESEIAQRIVRLEILFECNDSHPHFIERVIDINNCLPEEITYLKLLKPPEKLSVSDITSKIIKHSPSSLNINKFFKEKLPDKVPFPSKIEYFMTYIGNQIRSAQFLKLIAIIPLAFLCVVTACSAKYLIFNIFLALLLLTSLMTPEQLKR